MAKICPTCERKKLYEIAIGNQEWRHARCEQHQGAAKQKHTSSLQPRAMFLDADS